MDDQLQALKRAWDERLHAAETLIVLNRQFDRLVCDLVSEGFSTKEISEAIDLRREIVTQALRDGRSYRRAVAAQ